VERAADSLLRDGERPTIEKIRARLGRGSPNTVNPLLDQWWQRLAARLDAGPAALQRIPEPVAHAAELLWMQALQESRRRVALETRSSKAALDRDRQDLAVQTHVLSLRESEIRARLEQAEQRTRQLETEVQALTTMLRKERASRLSVERRLADAERMPPRRRAAAKPKSAKSTKRPAKSRKPARAAARKRTANTIRTKRLRKRR
jgi:chromosome segregation ATPase